ncbi:MAG: T9SS type A sorting domain-containing protein [Saprospiraceae bacterium]|nr:T9SS type A sorting domain-containing protein [Saprospiraceae bacterium]MDW8484571.1 HmuY family protein [Saprospiraceae bacterium]
MILNFVKQLTLGILFSVIASWPLIAQTFQQISTGPGYQRQSYVDLAAGTEKQVPNTAWDIAFTVYGQQDAGIFINESAGTSMGQPQAALELYDARTSDFSSQPNLDSIRNFRLYNRERNWFYGAFNERRDTTKQTDYGWGTYNFATNQVVGNAVYVLKLRNGQFLKIKIESLIGTTYTFRYANLDGTNEQVKTINKANHPGKVLAYFSFATNDVVDVEPSTGFDLVYCRYTTPQWDSINKVLLQYMVTGILHGRGVQAAKAIGVDPKTVKFSDYQNRLHSELDVIGHDWKTFTGSGWNVPQDRVYFVKTANNRVWKIQFIDFEGAATGNAVFEKTDLGVVSALEAPQAVGLQVLTYPNPVRDRLSVLLEVPSSLAREAQLEVVDLQGRIVNTVRVALVEGFQLLEMSAAEWVTGIYALRLRWPEREVFLGKVIKN